MQTQFITKFTNDADRPSLIERLSQSEAEELGFTTECGESILELIFFGTPLKSCRSFDENKWIIQVYVRTEHYEFTGYPNGREEYCNAWNQRHSIEYSINEFLSPFLRNGSTDEYGVIGKSKLGDFKLS